MKFKIVFSAAEKKSRYEAATRFVISRKPKPTRSLVLIHFPARNMTLSYYNDQFDLHCGDLVTRCLKRQYRGEPPGEQAGAQDTD